MYSLDISKYSFIITANINAYKHVNVFIVNTFECLFLFEMHKSTYVQTYNILSFYLMSIKNVIKAENCEKDTRKIATKAKRNCFLENKKKRKRRNVCIVGRR